MEDRLEVEEQIARAPKDMTMYAERQSQTVEAGLSALDESIGQAALDPKVQELISRCMEGTEPYDVEGEQRAYWQQKKFSAINLQVVMLRCAGFKQVEIAKMLGLDHPRVNITLKHPYAKKIIRALIPEQVTRVIDIRTRMEQQASELMDHAFFLAMQSEELKEVKDVTFGFLDRAGYNPVNKTLGATGTPQDFMKAASEKTIDKLASAMEESRFVDAAIMPNWVAPRPPEESTSIASEAEREGPTYVPESVGVPAQPESVLPERFCSTSKGSRSTTPKPEPGDEPDEWEKKEGLRRA